MQHDAPYMYVCKYAHMYISCISCGHLSTLLPPLSPVSRLKVGRSSQRLRPPLSTCQRFARCGAAVVLFFFYGMFTRNAPLAPGQSMEFLQFYRPAAPKRPFATVAWCGLMRRSCCRSICSMRLCKTSKSCALAKGTAGTVKPGEKIIWRGESHMSKLKIRKSAEFGIVWQCLSQFQERWTDLSSSSRFWIRWVFSGHREACLDGHRKVGSR